MDSVVAGADLPCVAYDDDDDAEEQEEEGEEEGDGTEEGAAGEKVIEFDITMQDTCRAQIIKNVQNFRSVKGAMSDEISVSKP